MVVCVNLVGCCVCHFVCLTWCNTTVFVLEFLFFNFQNTFIFPWFLLFSCDLVLFSANLFIMGLGPLFSHWFVYLFFSYFWCYFWLHGIIFTYVLEFLMMCENVVCMWCSQSSSQSFQSESIRCYSVTVPLNLVYRMTREFRCANLLRTQQVYSRNNN